MKRRRYSLMRRMMAIMLSAALVAGLTFNAVSITVLAQETDGWQESVSGNDAETETVEETENVAMEMEILPQDANIASGKEWVIDGFGKLIISSDVGMEDWCRSRRTYYHDERVTSIEIKSGVTEIGYRAFESCNKLASIAIPDSIESIGNRAFHSCSSLTGITIPKNVRSIGEEAFHSCSGLTSIVIPEGVTEISWCAFANCSGLKSVTIPEGVTSISSDAFNCCSSLTSITIPESVVSIGGGAFWRCSSLTSITIPENVMSIKMRAFEGCSGLTEIIMLGETPPTVGMDVFLDCGFVQNNIKGIHVPKDKTQTYQEVWTAWAAYITEPHIHNLTLTPAKPAGCTKDGNQAYYTCDGCDEWFSDAAGMQKITDRDSVVINKPGHDWGEWVIKTPASEATPGQKERFCKRCGQTETATIPATGNGGDDNGSSDHNNGSDNNSSSNNNDSSSDNNSSSNNNDSNSSNDSNNNNNNGSISSNGNNGNSNNDSSNHHNSAKNDAKPDPSRDGEPKTGDAVNLELYATVAMIAGFAYLFLYFSDRERGMTEEIKKELVSRIVRWANRGGRIRKYLALAVIFVLLVYYHSIGKKTCAEWSY